MKKIKVNIGRKGIFGNPYIPFKGEERHGKTLQSYEGYLRRAIENDILAHHYYEKVTGIRLPLDFKEKVRELASPSIKLWCPGCKTQSCENGVCHGSILLKVARELNSVL